MAPRLSGARNGSNLAHPGYLRVSGVWLYPWCGCDRSRLVTASWRYVGVSWPTLRQVLVDQAIPHVRLGKLWRVEVAVLDAHLRRQARVQVRATAR